MKNYLCKIKGGVTIHSLFLYGTDALLTLKMVVENLHRQGNFVPRYKSLSLEV